MKQRLTIRALVECHRLVHENVQLIEFCRLSADFTMQIYSYDSTGLSFVSQNPDLAASDHCPALP